MSRSFVSTLCLVLTTLSLAGCYNRATFSAVPGDYRFDGVTTRPEAMAAQLSQNYVAETNLAEYWAAVRDCYVAPSPTGFGQASNWAFGGVIVAPGSAGIPAGSRCTQRLAEPNNAPAPAAAVTQPADMATEALQHAKAANTATDVEVSKKEAGLAVALLKAWRAQVANSGKEPEAATTATVKRAVAELDIWSKSAVANPNQE